VQIKKPRWLAGLFWRPLPGSGVALLIPRCHLRWNASARVEGSLRWRPEGLLCRQRSRGQLSNRPAFVSRSIGLQPGVFLPKKMKPLGSSPGGFSWCCCLPLIRDFDRCHCRDAIRECADQRAVNRQRDTLSGLIDQVADRLAPDADGSMSL
jgi:hypothetical protein